MMKKYLSYQSGIFNCSPIFCRGSCNLIATLTTYADEYSYFIKVSKCYCLVIN